MESPVNVQALWRYLEDLEPNMDNTPIVFQDEDGANHYIRSIQEYVEVGEEDGFLKMAKRFIILKSETLDPKDIF